MQGFAICNHLNCLKAGSLLIKLLNFYAVRTKRNPGLASTMHLLTQQSRLKSKTTTCNMQSSELFRSRFLPSQERRAVLLIKLLNFYAVRTKRNPRPSCPASTGHLLSLQSQLKSKATTCNMQSSELFKSRFLPSQERRAVLLIKLLNFYPVRTSTNPRPSCPASTGHLLSQQSGLKSNAETCNMQSPYLPLNKYFSLNNIYLSFS